MADFRSKQPDMRFKMAKVTDFKVDRPLDAVHRGRFLVLDEFLKVGEIYFSVFEDWVIKTAEILWCLIFFTFKTETCFSGKCWVRTPNLGVLPWKRSILAIIARDWENQRSIGLVKFWKSFTHFSCDLKLENVNISFIICIIDL